ncbi:hypothetical protein ASZ78_003148 [Callipepla squamata]|uniref:SEA domain-containing protein n=1 Tax=Callipepla squamata TaxID=9009 RepID=A0A226MMX1_CALSU|nr:hypothetical protein ASZ78_003148 [Callipepla squamata]
MAAMLIDLFPLLKLLLRMSFVENQALHALDPSAFTLGGQHSRSSTNRDISESQLFTCHLSCIHFFSLISTLNTAETITSSHTLFHLAPNFHTKVHTYDTKAQAFFPINQCSNRVTYNCILYTLHSQNQPGAIISIFHILNSFTHETTTVLHTVPYSITEKTTATPATTSTSKTSQCSQHLAATCYPIYSHLLSSNLYNEVHTYNTKAQALFAAD